MAAPGFSFGSSSLFGAKTTASTGLFGSTTSTASTGLFGNNANPSGLTLTKTTGATTGLFGGTKSSTTGGLFGGTTLNTAPTGLLGATTSSISTGGLFGASSTNSSNTLKLGSGTGLTFGGGLTSSTTSSLGGGLTLGTAATSTAAPVAEKLENPKEAKVPSEITTLFTDVERYISAQKEVKDQISKISGQAISKCLEEVTTLKQLLALVANGINRDSVSIESLKNNVSLELKYADIAHKVKDIRSNIPYDFAEPMEYFRQLVFTFENQINSYRQEINELETVLSSTSSQEFSPQHLSETLKRMSDTFLTLASQVQPVHEAIKALKQKYLAYRQIVHNDSSDPFKTKKVISDSKDRLNIVGPSPFPAQHRTALAAPSSATVGAAATSFSSNPQSGISSSFFKPSTGQSLFRSLSSGGSSRSNAAAVPTLGATLFNNSGLLPAASPTVNSLQLQKSAGKRVKF